MASIKVERISGFGRGKVEQFAEGEIRLGTAPDCHVQFDPNWDRTVAPCHAIVWWDGFEAVLEDSSSSGCFVGGRRVSREALAPGATIDLGLGGPRVRVDFTPARREAAPAPATPPVLRQARSPQPRSEARNSNLPWVWTGAGIGVLLVVAALAWLLGRGGRESDSGLAAAAERLQGAVGLVVVAGSTEKGPVSEPMATACAIGDRVFATNAHVVDALEKVMSQGASVFVAISRRPELRLRVVKTVMHPRYASGAVNFDGREPAVPPFDVGLLYTDGPAPVTFSIASRRELERLDSGYRIAYLGFPMEGLVGGGVDARNPVATMQSGILTAVTDYYLSKSPFEKRHLLQHNLGSTGGASGSAVFNARGELVGLLSAVNATVGVDLVTKRMMRQPSAALINFAQRIDLLRDIWADYPGR